MEFETKLIKLAAPEDLEPGQYVAIYDELREYLTCALLEGPTATSQVVQLRWLPDEDELPLRIIEVCVPFVLARRADGGHRTLDLRRYRLARLSPTFGREVFRRYKRDASRSDDETKSRKAVPRNGRADE